MLLRKTMSLLGIGSAIIDLVLEKNIYYPGEKVNGYFLLKGGTIEQYIKRIDCDLIMVDSEKKKKTVVETTTILSSRLIEVHTEDKLPFSIKLPLDIRKSGKSLYYYFETKLFFNEGVESKDQDTILIISKVES